MGALGFGMAGVGLVLIWAGVKGEDLREVVTGVFSGRRRFVGNTPATVDRSSPAYRAGQEEQADRLGGGRTDPAQQAKEAAKAAGFTAATAPPGTVAR